MGRGVRVPSFLRRRMILSTDMVDFELRGFRVEDSTKRKRLEAVCFSFLAGYNAVVEDDIADPVDALARVEPHRRGWAYEGAGMACAMLDILTFSRGRRLATLMTGSGDPYIHLIHIGVGWAPAQLRLPGWGWLRGLHPLYRWLGLDGGGFWRGFFQTGKHLGAGRAGRPVHGMAAQVRDQGIGRSLWFVECADVPAITARIASFHESRHADLWAGVGLAAAYAGGANDVELDAIAKNSGTHRADLAQGAVFAAVARVRSGVIPSYTEQAVRALTGVEPAIAAEWEAEARSVLHSSATNSAAIGDYQQLRTLIRQTWLDRSREQV